MVLLVVCGRFEIENLSEIRRTFRVLVARPGPLLICANHLTYVDSAIILWALAPIWWYSLHYRKLSWNLPAGDHFRKGIFNRLVAFFFKCIFVHRDGSAEHKASVLAAARDLLMSGEPVTIFPEGRRSRSGRVDSKQIKYGVGKLLASLPNATVLCLYVRGHRQEAYSKYPVRGSRFRIGCAVLRPSEERSAGDKGHQGLSLRVVSELSRLEDDYFLCASRSSAQRPNTIGS